MRSRIHARLLAGSARGVGAARRTGGLALGAVLLSAGTAAMVGRRDDLEISSVLLIYLLAVVVVAAVGGLLPGLLAAVVAFGLVAWFFTPPFHTLAVHGSDAFIELVVFGVVAAIVSATVEVAARDRGASERLLAEHVTRTRELAAADRVRSALLAAVGHDLRTPLASIKLAAGSLRHPGVEWSRPEADEMLATIEESSDRLTSVVTNLVDMTRLRADAVPVRMGPVALDEVVGRALLHERRDRVVAAGDARLPPVLADQALLERVVENLVENAVRFSPDGAVVEVRAELTGPPAAPDRDAPDPDAPDAVALLHVVDHGPGIREERRTEVFTAFHQLDDRGPGSHVGLGLAIVHGFTEAMGIAVQPSTTPGGGLTMTLVLPLATS